MAIGSRAISGFSITPLISLLIATRPTAYATGDHHQLSCYFTFETLPTPSSLVPRIPPQLDVSGHRACVYDCASGSGSMSTLWLEEVKEALITIGTATATEMNSEKAKITDECE
ncbi:hypothetical protein TcWFU_003704 [Taenia crassiceps]|uniref:Secreted protein n=1 Tax=Taenia crassiceps TaxID=6207 RepID=A0ABR4QBB0_9CEST